MAALRIQPRDALIFGLVTNAVAFSLFFTLVNPLSAVLTLSGDPLLRLRLYDGPEEELPAEHSDRGRGRRAAARHRVDRGNRELGVFRRSICLPLCSSGLLHTSGRWRCC